MGNLSPTQFHGFQVHEDNPVRTFGKPTVTSETLPSGTQFHTNQSHLDLDTVDKYASSALKRLSSGPASVVEHQGQYWVNDGHHRLAAAMQRGKPAKVRVTRWDGP